MTPTQTYIAIIEALYFIAQLIFTIYIGREYTKLNKFKKNL